MRKSNLLEGYAKKDCESKGLGIQDRSVHTLLLRNAGLRDNRYLQKHWNKAKDDNLEREH